MLDSEIAEFWRWFRYYYNTLGQRKGQAMMNSLAAVSLVLYDDISGTSKDCFYRDDQVFAFRDYLGI